MMMMMIISNNYSDMTVSVYIYTNYRHIVNLDQFYLLIYLLFIYSFIIYLFIYYLFIYFEVSVGEKISYFSSVDEIRVYECTYLA